MLIPDVLALPLAEAIARLEAAEIGYTVAATQPPQPAKRSCGGEDSC